MDVDSVAKDPTLQSDSTDTLPRRYGLSNEADSSLLSEAPLCSSAFAPLADGRRVVKFLLGKLCAAGEYISNSLFVGSSLSVVVDMESLFTRVSNRSSSACFTTTLNEGRISNQTV